MHWLWSTICMFEYIKINNILTMKLCNKNFKLITIWRKVTRLGISFLNQPFFSLRPEQWLAASAVLSRCSGCGRFKWHTSLINDLLLRIFGKIPPPWYARNTLNFLELKIIKNSNSSLIKNWFKKPTWSGCYLNYESHHLFSQKIGLIQGLVDRCIKLSDIKYWKENLDEIKVMLQLNSYPLPLIECH